MTELPQQAQARRPGTAPSPAAGVDDLVLMRWHIDRYDRLRASTASRAAVVLSAGAILSAGNAVVLAQVLGGAFDRFPPALVAAFTVGVMAGAVLVVLAILAAADVLVTPRPSAEMFGGDPAPPVALLFNGTYTVAAMRTYEQFRAAVVAQDDADVAEAARVELYFCIRQHRHRYQRLRGAVRLLRWAAMTFLVVLACGVAINIAGRF